MRGVGKTLIANYLRLLKLDPIIQTGIRDGFISMGHGRAIINIGFRHSNRYLPKNSQSKPVRSRYGSFSKKTIRKV
jgi:hypothetical protein